MNTFNNTDKAIPTRVILLRPDPAQPHNHQLFIDQLPIPRNAWRFDDHEDTLTWNGAHGGGKLHFYNNGLGAHGVIGDQLDPCSVNASARAQFNCAVALNAGVAYQTSGNQVTGLLWDTNAPEWKAASWVQNRLLLTYTVTQGGPFAPPSFTFEFEDLQSGDIPWDPSLTDFAASLQLGSYNDQMVWDLTFKATADPFPDSGNPTTGPDTVYPYWLSAREDAYAATINGAMEIDDTAPNGTLVGLQGVRNAAMATGYYRLADTHAPFGVFDGRLVINGQPVPGSGMRGSVLTWEGLAPALQQRTGLAESGSLWFEKNGNTATPDNGPRMAARLDPVTAAQAIAAHSDLHTNLHEQTQLLHKVLNDSGLTIDGLFLMKPFVMMTDEKGQKGWTDIIQSKVRDGLSTIMNSCIPDDLYDLLFQGQQKPTLSGELAIVAASPVKDVKDPQAWYASLATAVLTHGLSSGSSDQAKYMNGPRAAEWLKTQVANSPVYYAHGQLLFHYEWKQKFAAITDYLDDQLSNAAALAPQIDQQVQLSIADINANVAQDDTTPDLKAKLIAEVQAVGQYAKDNKLYWAFRYYTYNTAPGILANIALQMGANTGSADATTLGTLFQTNQAVLTALDPSGYFARQYNNTVNIFLATNILPGMFGFENGGTDFDIIKQYLQQFVDQNVNNEDQQIAAAAKSIQGIINSENADAILHDSIDALRSFSEAVTEAMNLPYVVAKFVARFKIENPNFSSAAEVFGGVLVAGIAGLSIFNLIGQYKQWDKLSDGEKGQLVTNTIQLGVQVLAAIVKRGIRAYAIFNVEGMSKLQRFAALNKILISGEAQELDWGLMKIGNTTARWLADTEGSLGRLATDGAAGETAVLINNAATDAEETSFAAKVFGKNLDEFVATRLGTILVLAGIGFSIYMMTTGETGVALASDIINVVGGALALFNTFGEWAILGGYVAEEGAMATLITCAGPLAILAALAGIGLMLYQLFKKQPDPVEDFVNNYVKPAGFYVGRQAGAMDYAVAHQNPDKDNLMMIGFTLTSSYYNKVIGIQNDGRFSYGANTSLPDTVWQASTDAQGMSRILTIIQPAGVTAPKVVFLSLMSDQTVSFQPLMPAKKQATGKLGDPVTVLTQTWLSGCFGATNYSNKQLASLLLQLQPVLPDDKGNYAPSQAKDFLMATDSGLAIGNVDDNHIFFTLEMAGMAPNYLRMTDLHFILNSAPSAQQQYGPVFGILPSTPLSFSITNTALPPFLTFSIQTGSFTPNGQKATQATQLDETITVKNILGSASAAFKITVAAAAKAAMPSSLELA
ncbi:hypothetical protein F0L74_20335 [Chitinophaga agrisoli]|uniref:Uncharacterized protein n=2 Tax=Chitinophaga agrisoli TaxID=2607653 RepID=A0A5B2VRN0_9BACT|nr:hypothetical protein F0L74_20335 [Chitinophaga agrisoli]